jgi:hypothetical protein
MSGETKKGKALPVSYTPPQPPKDEPQMSAAQYQSQQEFFFGQVERFKKLFEDSTLAKYIMMAGIGGVVIAVIEVVRAFIQVVCYLRRF